MIWNAAPHRCAIHTLATGTDAGMGTTHTYAPAQADVPCLNNTASARTVEMYAQEQISVSHTISIKSSLLTTPVARGAKVVVGSQSYHVEGIRSGEAFLQIPAFTYLDCSELL